MRLSLAKLDVTARLRFSRCPRKQRTYIDDVLSVSVVDGEWYELPGHEFTRLREKYGKRDRLPKNLQADDKPALKLRTIAHAAKSIAKTSIGIDRANDEQIEARLDICRHCPGNHAVWRQNGKTIAPKTAQERDRLRESGATVFTCGPMLEQQKRAAGKTCGCILDKKARDLKERCPNGWWPNIAPAAAHGVIQ